MNNRNDRLPGNIKTAFFDLDETLTSRETDQLWALWRIRSSPRGILDLMRLRRINRLYYSHKLEPEDYKQYHLSRARSLIPEKYRQLADEFASFTASRYIYKEMEDLLESNRQRGIRNILITAQDEILAEAFSYRLRMDGCLASRYLIKDGKFSDMALPLCFKEGKVYWAGRFLNEQGMSWADTAFYSDSLNDLPLLEECAYPVAVHPSQEFEALCKQRSWPILKPV